MNDTAAVFEAALVRLITGQPSHPDLQAKAAAGQLRISISTVAKEAGRSRTLIGHEGCPYPKIRQRILDLMDEGPRAQAARDLFKKTATRNSDLTQRLAAQESIQAALVLELGHARRALELAKPRLVRK